MSIHLEMPNWRSLIIITNELRVLYSVVWLFDLSFRKRRIMFIDLAWLGLAWLACSLFLNLRHMLVRLVLNRIWFNAISPIPKTHRKKNNKNGTEQQEHQVKEMERELKQQQHPFRYGHLLTIKYWGYKHYDISNKRI